jgi:hypothetical protein
VANPGNFLWAPWRVLEHRKANREHVAVSSTVEHSASTLDEACTLAAEQWACAASVSASLHATGFEERVGLKKSDT